MIRARNIFALLLLLCTAHTYADSTSVKMQHNIATIERYLTTSDTLGLNRALVDININLHLYRDEHYPVLFNSGARKAERENNPQLAQAFYTFTGLWHRQHNNIEAAVDNLVKAYELVEKQGRRHDGVWMLIELGNIFFGEGEPEQAAIFYNKALAIAKETNDHYPLSVIYLNMGLVEHNRGNLQREIELLKKSSSERLLSTNPSFVSHTYAKLAEVFLEMNQPDSAWKYIGQAREIYYAQVEQHGLLYEMPAMLDLDEYKYYMATGNKVKADSALKSAREYLLKIQLAPMYLQTYITESKYLFDAKDYKSLAALLDPKVKEFRAAGMPDLERQGLHYLAQAWSMLGDKNRSMQSYERIIALEDSLRNTRSKLKLNQVRSIIDLFEKESDLRLARIQLQHEQENEKLRLRERDIMIVITLTGFVIAIVLYVLMKRIQRQKRHLQLLHRELEHQHVRIQSNALKLERSNLVKDKLFSIIGHDLRGPMNSLLGMVGVMRIETAAAGNRTLDPHLRLMETTLKETVDLFEQLLQWSKLDKKEIHFNAAPINIDDVVSKVIRFYEPALSGKRVSVHYTPSGQTAYADINIAHTVMRNLIANAIQALPADKSIFITCEPKSATELVIRVRDNGYGYHPELLQRYTNEQGADVASNTGLGLVLCRELARMNKGRLTISNHEAGGAEACFTLPMLEANKDIPVAQQDKPFVIPGHWKIRLEGLGRFKVYQATQVKTYIRNIGETDDTEVQRWLGEIEKAVFLCSKERYEELVKMVEN